MNVLPVAAFSFLTNHGLALLCVAHDAHSRIRDIATSIDVTERAAQRIVSDLVEAGCVTRVREGRRNVYAVDRSLRVALLSRSDIDLGALLVALLPAVATDERRELIAESQTATAQADHNSTHSRAERE